MPMPRKIVDLVVDEISLVDNPANVGARILLHKGGRKLEDLEGLVFIRELERRAAAAEPDLSPSRALEAYLALHPALRRLLAQAQSLAAARDANAKRASGLDRLTAVLTDGTLTSLRLVAELEEMDQAPGQDSVYEAQLAEALRGAPAGITKGEAFSRFYRAHPEAHAQYRAAGRQVTKAREALVIRLFEAAIAPVFKALTLEHVPEREAAAIAWQAIPGLYNARRHAIARAKRGATVAQLEAGHGARCEMVRKLAALVLKRKVSQGTTVSFEKALEDTLAGNVGLRRELATDNEEGETA